VRLEMRDWLWTRLQQGACWVHWPSPVVGAYALLHPHLDAFVPLSQQEAAASGLFDWLTTVEVGWLGGLSGLPGCGLQLFMDVLSKTRDTPCCNASIAR